MKLFNLALAFLLVFFAAEISAQKSLPSVSAKTLSGETVDLQDYAKNGKVTVFSFWATWCSPCKRELDAIAEMYPDWLEAYDVELVAITIDTRRALSKVPAIVATKGWEYTILAGNDQEMRNAFNFQTIPHTVVLGKDGNIAYVHNGYAPGDEVELEDVVADLSKAKVAPAAE